MKKQRFIDGKRKPDAFIQLIEANVLWKRKATCYASVKTDLINASADYLDKQVARDGRLVTAQGKKTVPHS